MFKGFCENYGLFEPGRLARVYLGICLARRLSKLPSSSFSLLGLNPRNLYLILRRLNPKISVKMTEKQSKSKMTKKRNPSNLPSKSPADKKSKKNPKREDTKLSKKKQRKSGPRLPSVLLQELDRLNPNPRSSDSESNDEAEAKVAGDLYEYEEDMAQEETKKNRRYDPVENYEYELPEDFKVRMFFLSFPLFILKICWESNELCRMRMCLQMMMRIYGRISRIMMMKKEINI